MYNKIVILYFFSLQLMIIFRYILGPILLINHNRTLHITMVLLQHIINDILLPQRFLSLWRCFLQIQLVLDLLTCL
jgi:hypothetical protein